MLPHAEDRHDVRVVQQRRGPRLPPEPEQRHRIRRRVVRQDLQGHVPAQALLHRLVDDPHPAMADLAEDAVVP
jgi:hypothetical protein